MIDWWMMGDWRLMGGNHLRWMVDRPLRNWAFDE